MSDKKYWTTLEQLDGAEEYLRFRDDEFREKPIDDMEEGGGLTTSRRGAIKATGAAAIFASAVGCSPEKKLIPYYNQPEESIPGNPVYYTGLDADGENALVVKTTEGRPIRLDGNADFPVNLGKLDANGNAAIIDLYDPDRLRTALKGKGEAAVEIDPATLSVEVASKLRSAGSKAVLVTKPVHGVANKALIENFLAAFPGMRHVEISTHVGTDALMASQKAAFGKAVVPSYRYDKAKLIVSLGFDILAESPNPVEVQRLFAEARRYKEDGNMGRVVCFESTLSMTGGAGDERHRVKPQAYADIALALANELSHLGHSLPLGVSISQTAASVEKTWGIKEGTLSALAHELHDNKGQSLVVSGGSSAMMAGGELILAATNLLNVMLKNDGKTVQYGDGALVSAEETASGLSYIINEAKAGNISALVVADVNLAYLAPAKSGFADAMASIPYSVGLFTHQHETGMLCDAVFGTYHFLENWNDSEPRKGLYALGQPSIAPLWEKTISRQQALMDIAAAAGSSALKGKWEDLLKNAWQILVYNADVFAADFDAFWSGALRKGFVDLGEKSRNVELPVRSFKASALSAPAAPAVDGMQLVLYRTSLHGNGDSMNNAWLLEIPDPISKITWENFVSVNVAYAKKNKLEEGQYLTLSTAQGELTVPVHIQPGLADGVMALALGWGRGPEAGQVAAGPSGEGNGVNASLLAGYSQGKIVYGSIPVKWSKAGGSTKLACVQGHQYLENERIRTTGEGHRKILQDAFLEQFNTEGDDSWKIPYHMPTDISIWRQKFNDSTIHKWAMAIDTNTCTGCGSCMVSCQAENNISVVGKDEVLINREMHWIRIDRYYTAADGNHPEHTDEVDVVQQPMLCQHCDNAPCETVCPVVATTHNEEGLNVQTYNRCVGTRYCSNNCPYKVRHYNWYDYSDYRAGLHQSGRPLTRLLRQVGIKGKELKDKTEYPLMLQFNPDVTVRSRGVMEKCSFCVHKIRRWHTDERALGRDLPEAQKQTACQQACPADAITFGNILDENSAVSKVVEKKGAYKVLKELNTEANVTYLTRLRNRAMPEGSADAHGSHGETAHH